MILKILETLRVSASKSDALKAQASPPHKNNNINNIRNKFQNFF